VIIWLGFDKKFCLRLQLGEQQNRYNISPAGYENLLRFKILHAISFRASADREHRNLLVELEFANATIFSVT
jgi:hypothetical protein